MYGGTDSGCGGNGFRGSGKVLSNAGAKDAASTYVLRPRRENQGVFNFGEWKEREREWKSRIIVWWNFGLRV